MNLCPSRYSSGQVETSVGLFGIREAVWQRHLEDINYNFCLTGHPGEFCAPRSTSPPRLTQSYPINSGSGPGSPYSGQYCSFLVASSVPDA
jgi:hypothetical protein